MNIRDAFHPTEPRRCSDPEPYTERDVVIDPLTRRPVPPQKRTGNTSDQALARGHWIDALRPATWPKCGDPLPETQDADTQP